MSEVHSGCPTADGAVQGGEQEKGGAGWGAINGKGRRGISERDVKDRAGGRALGGTIGRRGNCDHQPQLMAGACVKSGLSGGFVTDPEGTSTRAREPPAV